MRRRRFMLRTVAAAGGLAAALITLALAQAQVVSQEQAKPGAEKGAQDLQRSSYTPVIEPEFQKTMAKMAADKPKFMEQQQKLLTERYDLSDRPLEGAKMFRGKAIQGGVRAKLPPGVTWDKLVAMKPEEIREKGLYPKGFMPLPHTNHPEGGMVFPKSHIDEMKKQTGRDLTRFDLDFDLPDPFVPDFPPAVFSASSIRPKRRRPSCVDKSCSLARPVAANATRHRTTPTTSCTI